MQRLEHDSVGEIPKPALTRRVAFLAALAVLAVAAAAQEAPSLAASADPAWSPLSSTAFGSELFEKWIPVPNGDGGAPRQGWLATADGFFTREVHLAYDYTDAKGPDTHEGLARFNYPLSRRLWAGLEVPFYQESGGRSNFGDITLTTQLMIAETKNLSINTGVGWRLPTGSSRLGNSVFAAQPQINFWSDVGKGFSLRGRVAYEFADGRLPDSFALNAAVGRTITPHSDAPFGDLTLYVAGNWREPTTGVGKSFVSITPGMRTHVGGNLFLLSGVEFPVTDNRNSFREKYIVQLVQGF
ncbi:transporter [Polymorphobacter sp. PAMC 29334]|uniref:transporter n=1 Tax=Polymorphobacter sp. PAMC 29334 TaxID=2862331 RepID=UPI001C77EA26|nr:transporter [Polymorphobacter sp. PAMC 29334]QYE34601.1 transporter [Polymorphobacter sp. PAMC 29334]